MMTEIDFSELFPALEYGGERVHLARWRHEIIRREETDPVLITCHEFLSPDGSLKVRVTKEEFRDFPALRCRNELIGCGDTDSQLVTNFDSLEILQKLAAGAGVKVRTLNGSKNCAEDFASRRFSIDDSDGPLDFICDEGRSSANWMPYFGFDMDERNGCEVAIGWSGAWRLNCEVNDGVFRCRFGMRDLATIVHPGEMLIQPSALLFRRDDTGVREFQSVIHDFMIAHNSPRDGAGRIQLPLLPIGTSGGNHPPEDMKNVIRYSKQAGLPCDTVWVDAGWNGPEHYPDTRTNCGDCWSKYVGYWQVNTGVHPAGTLKNVSDAAHAAGMRFLLWFEPERVMSGVPVFQGHPEFICKTPAFGKKGTPRYLLDLGNEAAWRWIFDTLCKLIRENGVDIYRQDFNMDPAPVWAGEDAPGRRGAREIKHIAGLYRLWDALRAEFPDLLIDNCASGGRRMDFELSGRSHVYCRSDHFVPRTGNLSSFAAKDYTAEFHRGQIVLGQNATVNTLAWIPFQAGEANCCTLFDDAEFFGDLGTGIVFSAPDWCSGSSACDFSEAETGWFRKMLMVADRTRRILAEKFLPLTEAGTTSEDDWAAYEGFSPKNNAGFAVFFRRKRAEHVRSFHLEWIDADARYLEDGKTGERCEVSGNALRDISVTLDAAPDGKLIFFKRLGEA